jgi:hypothetical protein
MAAMGVLPSAPVNSIGTSISLISRLNTLPVRTPVNASPIPSRVWTHDSGTLWFATPSAEGSFILIFLPVYPGALTVHASGRTFPSAEGEERLLWVA